MQSFDPQLLHQLYIPPPNSHKGQNGKLLLIGGSHLFHASVLWALEIASKIVDMVFFASVEENNQIVQNAKEKFRNGIVVPEIEMENYIQESDCILIGPGMTRNEKLKMKNEKSQSKMQNLLEILRLEDEGEKTYCLTKYLLNKYPHKKWVVDAGALQMLDLEDVQQLNGNAVLTPHMRELERVFGNRLQVTSNRQETEKLVTTNLLPVTQKYNCIVVLKGKEDIICSPKECVVIKGGNAGMTKGGTGDVLAGLIAALACKNDLWVSALAGSYLNKRAGESLFGKVGYYFNASDLVEELPGVMRQLVVTSDR